MDPGWRETVYKGEGMYEHYYDLEGGLFSPLGCP